MWTKTCMPREVVAGFEPADPARVEDMETRRGRIGIVEGRNAEIDRFRLMINRHQEGRAARAAETAMTEVARFERLHLVLASCEDEVPDGQAREGHCRRSGIELAGPAVAIAGVERAAAERVADGTAGASTRHRLVHNFFTLTFPSACVN